MVVYKGDQIGFSFFAIDFQMWAASDCCSEYGYINFLLLFHKSPLVLGLQVVSGVWFSAEMRFTPAYIP